MPQTKLSQPSRESLIAEKSSGRPMLVTANKLAREAANHAQSEGLQAISPAGFHDAWAISEPYGRQSPGKQAHVQAGEAPR